MFRASAVRIWLILALAWAFGCTEKSGVESGETHFLRACTGSCAGGLSCICGRCTSECSKDSTCNSLSSGASCTALSDSACTTGAQHMVCEMTCHTDGDCRGISEEHRCRDGVCRAPTGPSDASVDRDATDADRDPPDADQGKACGSKVCAAGQRCCDHCLGSCVSAFAELACPDELDLGRVCQDASASDASLADASPSDGGARDAGPKDAAPPGSDAANGTPCGTNVCAAGQVCCDHCIGSCVSQFAGIACPDDNQPNRSCSDAAVTQCAMALASCLATPCCDGLACCSGVPIPTGEARCYGGACPISDREQKTGFADIDHAAVLSRVLALPISSWRYKHEPASISHIGPMAQDFKASFGVGADDKHIFPLDEGGVSLAAIQALHRQLTVLTAAQDALREENARMRKALASMREELRAPRREKRP